MQPFPFFGKFKRESDLDQNSLATLFSHSIHVGSIRGWLGNWYAKAETTRECAEDEILTQAIMRVVIPHQPKMRLGMIEKKGSTPSYYILSEEVDGFHPLHDHPDLKTSILNNQVTHFGEVVLMAFFLKDTDFKDGNVGINADNQVVKLDGGWGFASFDVKRVNKPYTLSSKLLSIMPYPGKHYFDNYLDYFTKDRKVNENSYILDEEMPGNPFIREDINRAILKVLATPDLFFERLCEHVVKEPSAHIIFLQKRKQELLNAAAGNHEFLSYLNSLSAKECLREHIDHLKAFKIYSRMDGRKIFSRKLSNEAVLSALKELEERAETLPISAQNLPRDPINTKLSRFFNCPLPSKKAPHFSQLRTFKRSQTLQKEQSMNKRSAFGGVVLLLGVIYFLFKNNPTLNRLIKNEHTGVIFAPFILSLLFLALNQLCSLKVRVNRMNAEPLNLDAPLSQQAEVPCEVARPTK